MARKDQIEKQASELKPYIFNADRIQHLIDERLMNVATLAKIVGLTPAGISKIISGNQPRANTIGKLAAALGVKPGYFFDRD